MRVTIIGWSNKKGAKLEKLSHWPDGFDKNIAIARSAAVAMLSIDTIEEVLVEEDME